jgi:diguanylate cyclase (GGDEF)-like protein/putative nucleotidyltransferase with HDIG domain
MSLVASTTATRREASLTADATEVESLRERLARAEEHTAKALMRATRLAQIISVLGNENDLETTTGRIAIEIGELFFSDMSLLLLESDRGLNVTGHWGFATADLPEHPFALAEIAELSSVNSVRIGPAGDMELPDWIAAYQPRHVAWARLLVADHPIGVLMLARCGDEPFRETEATELRAISHRVALAVENGLLQQRMHEQLAQLRRLQEITATFAGILDLDAVGRQVADTLVNETALTSAAVLIDRRGELELLSVAGVAAGLGETAPVQMPLADDWRRFPLTVAGQTVAVVAVIGASMIEPGEHELIQHLMDLGALSLEKALLYEQTRELARRDSLTGLLGHRVCQETLEELAAGSQPFSVVTFDIDDFKQINDLYGHQAGDRTLSLIADVLRSSTRPSDSVFRIGGEEFCAVLPGLEERDAFAVAESLRRRVAAVGGDVPLPVTVSVGIASFPAHASSREKLLACADAAMYASKRAGKNRVTSCASDNPQGTSVSPRDFSLRLLHDKNPDTAAHSAHVATLAVEMARSLELDECQIENVRIAARLHDIGKIGVPNSILNKPGPLSDEEFRIVKTHPVTGAELLSLWGFSQPAAIVRQHHEHIDGSGYPAGLCGAQIMIEARIIHVAEAYVAMTRDRPYRDARSPADARAELERHRGTQFDHDVLNALLACEQATPA